MDRRLLWGGALLLLVLLSFAVRVSGMTAQSLWRDEVDAIRFSALPLADLAGNFARPGWNGPLFYVLLRFWMALTGSSEFALRYLSLCCGVLSVALVYRIGRLWFSPAVGALCALLIATSPYMVWYSQEAKMYALLGALATGTVLLYHQVLRCGDRRLWIAVIVLTWVTAGAHVLGILLIPTMAVLLAAWWPFARPRWRSACLALAVSALPGLLVLPWAGPLLTRGGDIGHHFTPLPGMVATMFYAFGQGILPVGGLWSMGLTIFALVCGTALWPDTHLLARLRAVGLHPGRLGTALPGARYVLAVWTWFFVPIVGLYAITLRVPMFVDRYLIWIGPAVYLLAARGLEQMRRRSLPVAVVCGTALATLNCAGIWQQTSQPLKSDFRAAAAYLRQHRAPDELILFHISYIRDTFEYYYGRASPAADGLATDKQTTAEAVNAAMAQRVAPYPVVWLVLSEPEMWDERGMTVAWLDAHGTLEQRADFARVSVIQYRMLSAGLP